MIFFWHVVEKIVKHESVRAAPPPKGYKSEPKQEAAEAYLLFIISCDARKEERKKRIAFIDVPVFCLNLE